MPVKLVPVLLLTVLMLGRQDVPTPPPAPPPFDAWLESVIADARDRGFDATTIDRTLVGLEPLQRVVESDRNQAEFVLTLDRYLNARLTPLMIRRGREMRRTHDTLLTRLERTYGVPRQYLLAVWGLESRFGRLNGGTPVFQALATLAWEPRRSEYFRNQLFDAMTIVKRGDIEVSRMTGSWAGAMGQTQFLPSSYLQYAVDFDGDGRRDIWTSTPDALASIANYLKGYGWQTGGLWGREVELTSRVRQAVQDLPQRGSGCFAIRTMTARRSVDAWREMGIHKVDGTALPRSTIDAGLAVIGNRAFLLYDNYDAILGYNCAHFYALSVSLLADRLR